MHSTEARPAYEVIIMVFVQVLAFGGLDTDVVTYNTLHEVYSSTHDTWSELKPSLPADQDHKRAFFAAAAVA